MFVSIKKVEYTFCLFYALIISKTFDLYVIINILVNFRRHIRAYKYEARKRFQFI